MLKYLNKSILGLSKPITAIILVVIVAAVLVAVLLSAQNIMRSNQTTNTYQSTQQTPTPSSKTTPATTTATVTKTVTKTTSITSTQAQASTPITTTVSPSNTAKGPIEFKVTCDAGSTNEAYTAYRRTDGKSYCWGWLGTHTYLWGIDIPLKSVSGEVVLGPSEGGREGKLYVEVSPNGGSYNVVWSRSVRAGEKVEFNIPLNGVEAMSIRIRVSPPPYSSGWLSVDHTSLDITTDTDTQVIEHDCHEGVHLEAKEAYSRSGDYCWGWLEHQTYDIGEEKKLDYVLIYVKLGPSEAKGDYGVVEIQVSSDGKQWDTISQYNIVAGGLVNIIAADGREQPFRYIRVKVSDETPGYYIDYTKIYLAVED